MWQEYLLFLLRTVTIVAATGLVIGLVAGAIGRAQKKPDKGHIVVENLGELVRKRREKVQEALLADRKAVRRWRKQRKAEDKAERRRKDAEQPERRAWVIDFKGDIQASEVRSLSESVTAVLGAAREGDTVLLRLESPGGTVPGYGLAASQLQRLRDGGLTLWACVDKVAASGGYMMACVADRIHAAPFAIVGSIGVVAQIPNVHRLLRKHDIDVEMHTAGEYKRTLTVLGENTKAGREKFREHLEGTHQLFKQHVAAARPTLDIDSVADGDHWYGHQAIEKGLVDELTTSDDVLLKLCADHQVLRVSYEVPKTLSRRLNLGVVSLLEMAFDRVLERIQPLR